MAGLSATGFVFGATAFVPWQWGLLAAGVGMLLAFLLLVCCAPALVLRLGLRLVGRSLYWLRRHSVDHVPRREGTLLVCHPLHGLDCLWLLAAAPRPVRLGLCTGLTTQNRLARWLLRWSGAVVLDGTAGPECLERFAQSLRAALGRGELVGLFAETVHTVGGLSLSLGPILELLNRDRPVPIVPVCIDHIWGSPHRWIGPRLVWHWPQQVPYRVDVSFGAPCKGPGPGRSLGPSRGCPPVRPSPAISPGL